MLINEAILSDSSKNRLDIVILKMKENTSLKMETKSHTEITVSPESNLVLSKTRAEEILGWTPKVNRAEGLKITYDFFKSLSKEELNKTEHRNIETLNK